MQTTSDVRRVRYRSGSEPGTRVTQDTEVTISVNSAYVTNIALSSRNPSDMSPFMRMQRLQTEAEERRTENIGHSCDHRGHSSHICSFVSPVKNRLIRNSPYNKTPRAPRVSASSRWNNWNIRPGMAPQSGGLSSSRNKSLQRLRGPVRFLDPGLVSQQSSLYPLDDDLTSKLSSIQLSSDSKLSSQPPEVNSATVTSDLSNLSLGSGA